MKITSLVFILYLIHFSYCIQCGGVRNDIRYGPRHERVLISRSSFLSSIRIKYSYVNFDLGSSDLNNLFKNSLVPAANSYFTSVISTYSVDSNIIVDQTKCDIISIPKQDQTIGVSGSDLIIYISTKSDSSSTYIAYAGLCTQDNSFRGIPTSGIMVINVPNFVSNDFSSLYSTVVHEAHHIFAMNSYLYNFYTKPDGSAYGKDEVVKNITIRGTTKKAIVTPNVLKKASEAFSCDNIPGIELEEYGGSGTAGSHWDMRIMYNEFMISTDFYEPVYSTLTAALLLDSGWYGVNYSYTTPPLFGNGAGCSFFDTKCLTNEKSNFPNLFCDDASIPVLCDVFSLKKSSCYLSSYKTTIPSAFQYFTNSSIGGAIFADYCPIFLPYSNGDCRNSSFYKAQETGEVAGDNSRCFISTLSTAETLTYYSACYPVTNCTSSGVILTVGGISVECPASGGLVTVNGYKGTLTCPKADTFCSNVPCPDGCLARGICVGGICQCNSGYSGANCLNSGLVGGSAFLKLGIVFMIVSIS